MNGAATRIGGSAGGVGGPRGNAFAPPGRQLPPPGMPPVMTPTGKALVEGYRTDILNGFEKEKPRYNPANENRPQSSALVDLKDPIQVHLLTETALSDSKTFEILAQEEVDDLKKQIQSLSMRIQQARANLAIQSKYRDAAISMARLYSPPKTEGKRRSLLGNRMSDSAKEAEMEKLASERRCEELATELFSLEKRLMEPQRRLLQHTAGVLQMTHRASSKKSGQMPVGPMMNGIPGSPESLYTYTNTRNSMEIPSDELDSDKSLYLPPDSAARPRKNAIEIPLKSPIREQNAQLRELREEVERVKEENERILGENMQLKTLEQQLKKDFARIQDERKRLTASEEQLREDQTHARDEISRLQSREQQLIDENAGVTEENSRIKRETLRMMDETNQFKNETSRLQDADSRLKAVEQQMSAETEALRGQSAGQLKAIADTEAKLEVLNRQLRDVIVAFNPTKNGGFGNPGSAAGSGETLTSQLEYMESGLAAAVEEQRMSAAEASRAIEQATAEASAASAEAAAIASSLDQVEASLDQTSVRVQALAQQVQVVLQQSDSSLPPPPEGSLDEQLNYLEESFNTVGSELSRALEASSSVSAKKQNIDQVDAVLMGLWEIIQSGYAEIEQQKAARRQNRAMGQGGDDDDDLSSNEMEGYTNEAYSLQAFSTKVQWLYAQATGLREQKYILQRQIKQQRVLNNRSESEKDSELKAKSEELEQTQHLLDDAEREATEAQAQLQQVLADMDTLQKTTAANEATSLKERTARITALEADVREAQSRLATAEASMATTQSQLDQSNTARAAAEAELATLQTQLSTASTAADAATAEAAQLQADLQTKDDELDRMNMMVVELKTEVAFAKAELDGAYGSRKQRAKEAAALSNSSHSDELNAQIVRLRAELENALRDLEEITRESIAAERERLEIEGRLDEVLGEKVELEGEVGGLRERLGREEQARRRKVEDELRALKRGQGGSTASMARGGLSPR
ncbi:Up-regulated during septation-domain-containing protein [Chaetomidium leptoderma]|uniref:Up-regulated during septation-domain-containing protein n=1 Tax=Chaetomidium leptoderma TaxID=669021 RepID=A0AAN6VQB7_9PEZI|nr:Up-regulated during septation-domain-containing protein [Chaetomidium leptoderma]